MPFPESSEVQSKEWGLCAEVTGMLLGSIFWHVTRLAVTTAFYYFQTSQPKQETSDIASTGRMSSSTKTHSIFKHKKNTHLYTKDIAYYKNSLEGWLGGGLAVWRQPESTVWSSLGQERVWWVCGGCGDVRGAETVLVSKACLCSQGWRALLDKVQALRAGSTFTPYWEKGAVNQEMSLS